MFDPACAFLLDLAPDNLFEPVGRGEESFRCKGCGAILGRRERKAHHAHHRAGRTRSENARERRVREQRIRQLERARKARS